jgi:cupin fold WbuC family metalloprotein
LKDSAGLTQNRPQILADYLAMTSLVRIDQHLLSGLSQRARQHSRRRLNHNFHEPPDVVNRMLNAIEPDSYICPHRYQHPPLEESFLVLRVAGTVIVFADTGELKDILVLN